MTNEELAQHWRVSLNEAKEISNFINEFYELAVILKIEGSQSFWQGVMYAYDSKDRYISKESKEKFTNREQAILEWSDYMRREKIPLGQAKQMRFGEGVPTDVFLAIKPVSGYESLIHHRQKQSQLLGHFHRQRS